jgi:hypothetical protein
MPCLLLGQSRPNGQLVKVYLASPVRIVHDDTSQLVVAPAQCVVSMLVPLVHWTCCYMVRRSWTGHALGMFAGRTQQHVAMALALGRSSPGGLRAVLGGGSKRQLVRTGFWRQMDNQQTATSSMRQAGLHHNCIVMAHCATYASVRGLLRHTHN